MTDHDHRGDGWTEYRLLVTAMLERHDAAIDEMKARCVEDREFLRREVSEAEGRLRDLIDEKFVQLGQMHQRQIENAKQELSREATDIQVAKITSRWEFWGAVIVQIGTLAAALVALFSK